MTNQISGTIEIENRNVYYEAAGAGDVLVLVHSGFLDSRMWDAQWQVFAEHFRVIRYDMAGYGKSDALDAPVARRAELHRLLQHLGVERAILLGCSLGGEVVIDFALEQPDRVVALIAVSSVPSGFEMQGEPPAEIFEMIEAMQQGEFDRLSDVQLRLWISGPYRQPEQVDAGLWQRAAEMNQIAVRNQTWALADSQPVDTLAPSATEQLPQMTVPTLLIAGALDNSELVRAATVMADAIPGASKVVMPGCAHTPNMEQPAEFNRIVLEFLRSV